MPRLPQDFPAGNAERRHCSLPGTRRHERSDTERAPRDVWREEEIRPGPGPAADRGPHAPYPEDEELDEEREPGYPDYTRRVLSPDSPRAGLTVAVCILFGVVAIIHIALMFHHMSTLRLLERPIGFAEANEHDRRQGLLAMLSLGGLLVLVIVYCVWIHRAYSNLYLFGARGLRYSPGWAVGGWFIPILNLVRPVQVMQEIWRASSPAVRPDEPSAWQAEGLSPRVGFWWAVYLFSGFFATFAFYSQNHAIETRDFPALRSATNTMIISEAVTLGAIIMAVAVVVGVYSRQKQKFLQLSAPPPDWDRGVE